MLIVDKLSVLRLTHILMSLRTERSNPHRHFLEACLHGQNKGGPVCPPSQVELDLVGAAHHGGPGVCVKGEPSCSPLDVDQLSNRMGRQS